MAFSAATSLGFFLLTTGNAFMAIRSRSRADDDAAATASFVVASYASLVLLFYCLRRFEKSSPTGSVDKVGTGGEYAHLFIKMGFGVLACDSALAIHHHARGDGDAASLAFVFVAYVGFVTLTWLFLRRFNGRARGAGAGQ